MDHAQYFNTMKNQILSEDFRKMQKLAGIITESQYATELRKLNENTDIQAAWDSVKDTDDFSKEDFLADFSDDGDGKPYINLPVGEMPEDMYNAIKRYLKKNGIIDESSPSNVGYHVRFPDEIEIERDEFPFDTDEELFDTDEDETFAESKLIKLKQFIKEEIQKMLKKNLTPEEIYQELEKEYWEGDNIEGLKDDERFLSLPPEMQDKLSRIIFNNMRQNFY